MSEVMIKGPQDRINWLKDELKKRKEQQNGKRD